LATAHHLIGGERGSGRSDFWRSEGGGLASTPSKKGFHERKLRFFNTQTQLPKQGEEGGGPVITVRARGRVDLRGRGTAGTDPCTSRFWGREER